VTWRPLALAIALVLPTLLLVSPRTAVAGTPPSGFSDTLLASGMNTPLSLDWLPDGSGRAVIVEMGGAILAWDAPSVYAMHTMLEISTGSERGLLDVAVDPGYPTRPYVYVHYTNLAPPAVQVARFNMTDVGGILDIDPATKLVLLDDMPDTAFNHNGGTLRFGPDGYLYISVGDDATGCNAQDLTILAGKILRIRVDDSIDPANRATLAPPTNPFFLDSNSNAKLVWAYGLRNPFRFGINPRDGRVFIGDVGQNTWEEVDAVNSSGLNFGWPYWEGEVRYQLTLCPGDLSLPPSVGPIYVYLNGAGSAAVIGATVYTGATFGLDASFPPAYTDDFFFMEYYTGWLRVLREVVPGTFSLVPGVTATNWGTGYAFVADMIPGADGALYFLTGGGELRRLAFLPATPTAPTGLDATLANGDADVVLTWTLWNPEANVDHYEVFRSSTYDPSRTGYAKVSIDLSLPAGSTTWTDVGAAATSGNAFYFVRAAGPNGESNFTAGQVAKFTRPLPAEAALLSVPVITGSTRIQDHFHGTIGWSSAWTHLASDAADPWKHFDAGRGDLTDVDSRQGVWVQVVGSGDYRVAGRVPCTTAVTLRVGWNLVGFPAIRPQTVAAATAGLSASVTIEAYDAATGPYFLRRLSPTDLLGPTEGLWVQACGCTLPQTKSGSPPTTRHQAARDPPGTRVFGGHRRPRSVRPLKSLISLEEALRLCLDSVTAISRTETIPVLEAAGRVTATDAVSRIHVPLVDRAAMDGYAVRAKDTYGAGKFRPKVLGCIETLYADTVPKKRVGPGQCVQVATGSSIPKGADGVVMVEHTESDGGKVQVLEPVHPGEHISRQGEDIRKGEAVIRRGERLTPAKIGALTAIGLDRVAVYVRPRVAILATGDEVLPPGKKIRPGQVYDINSYTLAAVVDQNGGEPVRRPGVADTMPALRAALRSAVKEDLVVFSGGSSVGEKDMIMDVLQDMGELLFHGIAVKPGKPTALGKIGKTAVLGMPGYPTSCLSNAYMILAPMLRKMARLPPEPQKVVELPLARKIVSVVGRVEFHTVRVEDGTAVPAYKESGAITSMAHADGYIEIPANVDLVDKGETVKVFLF